MRKRKERSMREDRRKGLVMNVETDEGITFSSKDLIGKGEPQDDPMVVKLDIANFVVHKVLIDNGSSADIIFWNVLKRMGLENSNLDPVQTPLVGFGGGEVASLGTIDLPVSMGEEPRRRTLMVKFLVVDTPFVYNVILGRPGLNLFRAIVSTYHQKIKFPTSNGVGEVSCDQKEARKCYNLSLKKGETGERLKRKEGEIEGDAEPKKFKSERMEPAEEYKSVELIEGKSDKTTRIGSSMNGSVETLMIELLKNHADIFAWSPSDFKGIDPEVIVHRLNVDPMMRPIKQKKRSFGAERNRIIEEEVNKLREAGYVSEVQYTDWLANVVVVPKASGKWRMCTDFTDLNKACPKDPYPLPRIDLLVDSTAGYELFSMMDAYQGYHQIFMAEEDRIKTSFITDQGIYCYNVMPFGLKNAGATYQRLVNQMFKDQIGTSMEVYVDDMLVKSTEVDHLRNLKQAFEIMRAYGMKLNPSKCTFGVRGGKFLGYMVSERGIEANPEKIEAIAGLRSPKTLKEVQKLTGKIASLSRFISRSADRSMLSFKSLGKAKEFKWTDECEQALQSLKQYLATPPLLSNPKIGEELFLYLAISDEAVVVRTNHPLGRIMTKPDASGRLVKWAVELGEQVEEDNKGWLLHVDGSSNSSNEGAGILLQGPNGVEIKVAARLSFAATNNEAEYEALILGLQLAWEIGAKELNVCTDSQLVAMQIEGVYETRERTMTRYLQKAKELMTRFVKCSVQQIPRNENERADALSKFGAMVAGVRNRKVTIVIKERSAIEEGKEVQIIEQPEPWREELIKYLRDASLPDDPIRAKQVKFKSARFTIIGDELYKRTISGPLLKCVDGERAQYVLREVHEGSCGNHSGGRSLAQKVVRQGYFWPTLVKDATDFAKRFGIPRILILDNGTQFQGKAITSWCKELKIQQNFTVVGNPRANGQTEVTNRTLLQHLKTRLKGAKSSWVEELPGVLWAYRTTPRSSTGETPFCLVYGTEAIIPAEIGEETLRVTQYDAEKNQGEREFDLMVIEEKRDAAHARILHHKGLMMRSYNRKIKPGCFQVGDLVLKKVEVSKHVGKLDPGWEGPYKVVRVKKPGTYKLQDMEGKDLPRPWNISNLRKFYA
ncbi:UNVERIFIED_CONTAM: Retrovirus-related Pol polyprotein from transposon gypsy [Sesamum radiatum]|uniref:Retrovirus-related Pol polyprotein from transposon gypsy n=1 Tax=Sesamum radiatum TaxID=300843 RepID=A0AAW2R2M6_SESRA